MMQSQLCKASLTDDYNAAEEHRRTGITNKTEGTKPMTQRKLKMKKMIWQINEQIANHICPHPLASIPLLSFPPPPPSPLRPRLSTLILASFLPSILSLVPCVSPRLPLSSSLPLSCSSSYTLSLCVCLRTPSPPRPLSLISLRFHRGRGREGERVTGALPVGRVSVPFSISFLFFPFSFFPFFPLILFKAFLFSSFPSLPFISFLFLLFHGS